jgi:predicted dehydrogenase
MEAHVAGKVVFGLIGAGGIAQSQHLPNLTRSDRIVLKTLCDMRADVLAEQQRKYRVPQATTDHKALLADPEIEAVVIATREESHADLAVQAMLAGKHVYCEKPLSITAADCQKVVSTQEKTGRLLAVGHNRRMAPAYQLARQILRRHGGARNIHYRISDTYWMWGRNFPPGFRIVHETCHVFDILRYLTGSKVTSVYCAAARPDDETVSLSFANGCVASIMSSGFVHHDMPKESLEAIVDLGAIIVSEYVELETFGLKDCEARYRFAGHTHPDRDQTHRDLLAIEGFAGLKALRRAHYQASERLEQLRKDGSESAERRELEGYLGGRAPLINYMVDKGWRAAMDHFAGCVRAGELTELATADDGWQVGRITEAAIQSRQTGQVVRLDPPA